MNTIQKLGTISISTTDNGHKKIKSFETATWFIQIVNEYYRDPQVVNILFGLKKPKGTASVGKIEMIFADRLIVKTGYIDQAGNFTVITNEDHANNVTSTVMKIELKMATNSIRDMLKLDEEISENSFQRCLALED